MSIDVHLFFVQIFACQKRKHAKTLSNIYTGRNVYILLDVLIIAIILCDFFGEVDFKCSIQCAFVDEVGVKSSKQYANVCKPLILGY